MLPQAGNEPTCPHNHHAKTTRLKQGQPQSHELWRLGHLWLDLLFQEDAVWGGSVCAERTTVVVAGPPLELMGIGASRANFHPYQVDPAPKGDGLNSPKQGTADTLLPSLFVHDHAL